MASSDTPDSIHTTCSSLQAALIAMRAAKLSTQLRTRSTGPPLRPPCLMRSMKFSKLSLVVMLWQNDSN
eukprot:747711-Hanusia_phi.AAC.3